MQKRIISLVLSVVTLVACFIMHASNTASLVVGAGNGVDEPINTPKELCDFLAFVAERDTSNMGAYELLSASLDLDEDEEETSKKKNKYESATISISTFVSAHSSSDNSEYSGGLRSSDQNVTRQLDIYFTEDKAYYVSKGVFSLVYERSSGSSTDVVNFDMEIFMTEDDVYVNFHEFVYVEGSKTEHDGKIKESSISRRIKTSMADQWIEMPPAIASIFISIDSVNRETMDAMRVFVEILDACDALEDEDVTSLDQDEIADFYDEWVESLPEEEQGKYGTMEFDDDQKVKFTLDLSNPTNPYISLVDTMDAEDTKEVTTGYDEYYQPITTNVTITNVYKRVQEITISNVNNTVINMDESKVSLSVDDDESFEKDLFIIKEKSDD